MARRSHRRLVVLALLVGLVLAPPVRPARAVASEQRCGALKLDATARAVSAHLGCYARALRQGAAVRPSCLASVDDRFAAAFARIEARGGCAFAGDAMAIDALIDVVVDDLVTALGEAPPLASCAAAKLRAAGRRAFDELACQRTALRQSALLDEACREQAAARFTRAFGYAERRFACGVAGDATTVQTILDGFTAQAATRIVSGPGTADPSPTSLAAGIVGSQIQLGWVAPPSPSGKTHVRVLRRLNAAPVDATDPLATVVFFGTASTASDDLTALLPTTDEAARIYHYAAFGCTAAGDCETTGSRTTLAPTLVQALRAGGYVLHWRHAAATVCQDQLQLGTAATTMAPDWWKSCDAQCPPGGMATARQLDANGVAEATAIGQAFDLLGIVVGRVLSSEFCRNVTTAALMDFGPTIEPRAEITYFVHDEAGRCDDSYVLLGEVPVPGTNTALIGHAGFSCPVLGALAWSEAAIFKPDGTGGSEFVTRVLWTAWADLQ
jgi:hypothetical protein